MLRLQHSLKYFVVAFLVAVSANHGVAADSPADARMDMVEWTTSSEYNSEAVRQLVDGILSVAGAYATEIAIWSYHHPAIAGGLLVHLPWILILAVALRTGTLGAATLYVAYSEWQARKADAQSMLRLVWEGRVDD